MEKPDTRQGKRGIAKHCWAWSGCGSTESAGTVVVSEATATPRTTKHGGRIKKNYLSAKFNMTMATDAFPLSNWIGRSNINSLALCCGGRQYCRHRCWRVMVVAITVEVWASPYRHHLKCQNKAANEQQQDKNNQQQDTNLDSFDCFCTGGVAIYDS